MEKVKRTKVVDLLKSTAYDSIVNVKGWVRTHRSSKAVDFIALNDGSTINNIQIVVDPSKVDENQLRQITTGACISVVGTLVESQGAGPKQRCHPVYPAWRKDTLPRVRHSEDSDG